MDDLDKKKFIFGNFFLIANKLQVLGDQHLNDTGITMKQWFLTAVVSGFGENHPTLSEVAELMGSTRQNVKQLALKLEEKEFIKIEKDANDARALRLKLTDKSRAFWAERAKKDEKFVLDLFCDWSQEEIDEISRAFSKLVKKLEG